MGPLQKPALFTKSVLKGWREWRKPLI